MMSPYSDRYADDLDESSGGVVQTIGSALLTISVTLWACMWGAIWLLSGIVVALHFHDDVRSADAEARAGEGSR